MTSVLLIPLMLLLAVQQTCSGKAISSANIETLKMAHVIFRHGSRSPLNSYPLDPYNNALYWPDGLGQLTAAGKREAYELGQYLRWRYSKFINSAYRPSDVYSKSSGVDRCIMSGELVLAGMFPPSSESPGSMWNPSVYWQPIPIHTLAVTQDNKLAFAAKCPQYEHLYSAYLRSSQLRPEYSSMYTYLTEHSGMNISNVRTASDLYDVLYVQETHNLTLPEWAVHPYYPEKLRSASEDVLANVVGTRELERLRGGPLLGEILLNIEQLVFETKGQVYPNPKAKLYLYSGHDTTIASVLGTLGIFDRQVVPSSSAAILEVHQERTFDGALGNYFVKVFFRNETTREPYELRIPECGDPCLLQSFKRLTEDVTILDWASWSQECQMKPRKIFRDLEALFSGFPMVALVLFLAGFLVATLGFATVWLMRRPIIGLSDASNNDSSVSATAATNIGTSQFSISNNNYKTFMH